MRRGVFVTAQWTPSDEKRTSLFDRFNGAGLTITGRVNKSLRLLIYRTGKTSHVLPDVEQITSLLLQYGAEGIELEFPVDVNRAGSRLYQQKYRTDA